MSIIEYYKRMETKQQGSINAHCSLKIDTETISRHMNSVSIGNTIAEPSSNSKSVTMDTVSPGVLTTTPLSVTMGSVSSNSMRSINNSTGSFIMGGDLTPLSVTMGSPLSVTMGSVNKECTRQDSVSIDMSSDDVFIDSTPIYNAAFTQSNSIIQGGTIQSLCQPSVDANCGTVVPKTKVFNPIYDEIPEVQNANGQNMTSSHSSVGSSDSGPGNTRITSLEVITECNQSDNVSFPPQSFRAGTVDLKDEFYNPVYSKVVKTRKTRLPGEASPGCDSAETIPNFSHFVEIEDSGFESNIINADEQQLADKSKNKGNVTNYWRPTSVSSESGDQISIKPKQSKTTAPPNFLTSNSRTMTSPSVLYRSGMTTCDGLQIPETTLTATYVNIPAGVEVRDWWKSQPVDKDDLMNSNHTYANLPNVRSAINSDSEVNAYTGTHYDRSTSLTRSMSIRREPPEPYKTDTAAEGAQSDVTAAAHEDVAISMPTDEDIEMRSPNYIPSNRTTYGSNMPVYANIGQELLQASAYRRRSLFKESGHVENVKSSENEQSAQEKSLLISNNTWNTLDNMDVEMLSPDWKIDGAVNATPVDVEMSSTSPLPSNRAPKNRLNSTPEHPSESETKTRLGVRKSDPGKSVSFKDKSSQGKSSMQGRPKSASFKAKRRFFVDESVNGDVFAEQSDLVKETQDAECHTNKEEPQVTSL